MSGLLLEGKRAVIYGGGGAIGGAVARVFAREGARVFIAGRSQEKLDAVADDVAAVGGKIETAQVDVFDQQAVEAHAAAVAAVAGGIDVALNATSVMHDQGTVLAELTLEEFMRPIDGFLRSLFITSKAVAPHMGRAGRSGVILTLSEPGAKLAVPGILGHAASAAGKEAFTRVLAAELAPAIRVIGIRPHAVVDAAEAGSYTKDLFTPEFLETGLAPGTLLKRLPTLSEVAETAAFLASDRSGVITGTIVNLSGGALVD
jgi:NAD(P)-dependent dehydrogenase (short-subunit alcohol dehydrogenase family)